MKRFLLLCAVTFGLSLFGCSQENAPPTITPTTVAETTPNPIVTPVLPTVTKTTTLVPTATVTATGTPTVTRTPRPATPPPTATPTPGPSPTLPPSPSGSIIFLWDPNPWPNIYPGQNEPKNNLYMAQPGETADEWKVDILQEGFFGWPATALSPDQTKLALTMFEDSNESGSITTFGPIVDSQNLFLYDLNTGDLIRLTDSYLDSWTLSWAPDSSTIAYARFERLFSVNVNSLTINTLIDQLPDKVARTTWSPDGAFLAIELQMGSLLLYNVITGEITYLDNVPAGNSETVQWSPNNEWLLSSIWSVSKGLFVVNVLSQETSTLVDTDYFSLFAWSPDSQYLAYGQGERNDMSRVFNSSILLWSTDTRTSHLLIPEIQTKSQPLWSPDGTQLTITHLTKQDEVLALSLIDIDTGQMKTLWQSKFEYQRDSFSYPIGWSPDGEWLLYYVWEVQEVDTGEDFSAGIYIVHRSGSKPILILDTSGKPTRGFDPYAFYWLSENSLPSLNDE